MYRALYRKWRPRTFDDVCGQDHITDILKYEVANNKTSHAYLFCGSRGTGKTTCAKLLSKAVNCESPINGNPCNSCASCRSIDAGTATDVVEMDAASNTSVDNVRDIKDEIVFSPAELRYRVYIIDEVHMLSTSAFNALLKTLEEPPSHVVFILATTEMQKLPSTIISRCQRFDFRRIATDVIAARLHTIASEEGIALTDSGARLVARMAEGGMRDAISLLELCAGQHKEIDEACVSEVLGSGNRKEIAACVRAVAEKNYDKLYKSVADVVMSSVDLSVYFQELLNYYRDMTVVKTAKNAQGYLDLTASEYEEVTANAKLFTMAQILYHTKLLEDALYAILRAGFQKRSIAEITLTRMCDPHLSTSEEALLARISKLEGELAGLKSQRVLHSDEVASKTEVSTAEKSLPEKKAPLDKPAAPKQNEKAETTFRQLPRWGDVIEEVRRARSSIAGFLDGSRGYRTPDGGVLIRVRGKLGANILKREDSLSILSGAIESELSIACRGVVTVESTDTQPAGTLLDELEENLQ